MRLLPAAGLGLLWLLPAAFGQESFSDPDFDFRVDLPVGMRAATDEERASLLKLTPEQARNVPRGEAAGAPISHTYIWVDQTTPYNRYVLVALTDGVPPYKNPTELRNSQIQEGLSVEVDRILDKPPNTVYVEGTFLSEVEQTPLRRVLLYLPDFVGRRYGVVTMQAFAADWDIVKSDFDAMVSSVRMKMAKAPVGPPTQAGGKAGKPVAPRAGRDTNAWSSLPVAGSLLLAAVVIGSLVFGRRAAA